MKRIIIITVSWVILMFPASAFSLVGIWDSSLWDNALWGQCNYSISPTSQSFPSSGGIGSVSVTATSVCTWTASENLDWVKITSGSSGTGNGTIAYSVGTNTKLTPRTGNINIEDQTFIVHQGSPGFPWLMLLLLFD